MALLSEFALRLEPLFVLKVLDLEKKGMEQFCSTVFRKLENGMVSLSPPESCLSLVPLNLFPSDDQNYEKKKSLYIM